MKRQQIPFNVSLLELNPQRLSGLKPVTVLDIFDGASDNFHENGLFSTSIFGRVGDERRSMRFSYIDIKVEIFHPIVFRAIVALKRLYAGIISGQEHAIWDPTVKDFEKSDPVNGKTGFHFFLNHWKDINHGLSKSTSREQNIKIIEKYKDKAMTSKIVVMPAGMRDLEVDDSGRMKEDEINSLYRALLGVSNTITDAAIRLNPEQSNTARWNMQSKFNELYDTIENMLEGKKKLILGKYGSRRIFNGTRNVITAMDTASPYLGAPGNPGFNSTVLGLYQMLKAIMPVARYHLRNGFLSEVFRSVSSPAVLVNKKTLKTELVQLKSQHFDRWATDEGLEKVITSFFDLSLRHKPLEIDGRYVGLVYKGPDGTFKLMHSIDELPESRDPKDVHPLTFAELLYLSTYRVINKHPLFVTRYPVTGVGSIYPSIAYVRTTIKAEQRRELSTGWEPQDESFTAYEFPIAGGEFLDSLVPHSAHLEALGADFDGDTASGNATYSDESIAEVNAFLQTKKAYVGTDGRFLASISVMTVDLVMHNMTGD
jgi:hypothetical protein